MEFIFKYIWVGILVLIYVIWGIVSIKNIIHQVRLYRDEFKIDYLDESTGAWIIISIIITFIASFGYWLVYAVE
jgi:hypothetical protein